MLILVLSVPSVTTLSGDGVEFTRTRNEHVTDWVGERVPMSKVTVRL